IAGLHGRNLELVENRVLKRLKVAGIDLGGLRKAELRRGRLSEEDALNLGLLFRALAPMRSRDRLRGVVEGIEAMGREEAAYSLHCSLPMRTVRASNTPLEFMVNPHGLPCLSRVPGEPVYAWMIHTAMSALSSTA